MWANPRAIHPFVVCAWVPTVPGMTTLTSIRERVRNDLSDTSSIVWTDEMLDRHIAHALSDLSLAIPRELSQDIATTAGTRDISLSGLEAPIDIEMVEYPIGRYPPCYPGFATWGSGLTLHTSELPTGDDARVFYVASHELDDAGSTLPDHLCDILVTGAAAYAALELSTGAANEVTVQPAASERYAALARARLTAFRQLLHTFGRKNRVRARRLYVPA